MVDSNVKTSRCVLVTGGAGYIGSHVCKALARAGYTPVTLDDLSRGHASAVKWGPLITGSVGDRNILDEVLSTYRPFAALHFAGFAYVGESFRHPSIYFKNNTCCSLVLLEAMRDYNVAAFVFSSTCATYGEPDRSPIQEGDPQCPVNPYGDSKLAVERMLYAFDKAHGVRSVVLRYFNAAGSDGEGEIGWAHEPETRLVPRALLAARGDIPNLEVFGANFPTPDGTCIRDYIHVSDVANAHVLALRYLENGGGSVSLNIGTGTGYSVYEVVDVVERITGKKIPLSVVSRRPGDPPKLIADPRLALRVLGFVATDSSIDTISQTAWRWLEGRPCPSRTKDRTECPPSLR